MRARAVLGIASVLFAAAGPVHAWLILGPDDQQAHVVAADADGNVVVAGTGLATFPVMKIDPVQRIPLWLRELPAIPYTSPPSFPPPQFAFFQDRDPIVAFNDAMPMQVHRLDALSGTTVWETSVADLLGGSARPGAIAVDASGDAVIGLRAFVESLDEPALLVVKLDGDDGTEIWRYLLVEFGFEQVQVDAVVALPSGDVLAAGFAEGDLQVVKLDGADGSELWRYTTPASLDSGDGAALVAGSAGDAFVAATTGTDRLAVIRLDGTNGTETWRYDSPPGNALPTIAIAPDGDVVASGAYRVVKLAASDGTQIWHTGAGGGYGQSLLNAQGDVIQVSYLGPARLTKLLGTSGAILADEYLVPFAGDMFLIDMQHSAVLAGRDVVAVGEVHWNSPRRAFGVFGFADRLSGAKLVVKDPGDPSVRTLRVISKDIGLMVPAPDDLRAPTAGGATLAITNPTTAETTAIALPASGWTMRPPSNIGGTLYKYLDKALANGPCKVVVLKGNRALKAKCDGAQLAFTLDEATQGSLDVRLTLAGGFARCLSFGGTVLRDEPGQFIARSAAAPLACAGGL